MKFYPQEGMTLYGYCGGYFGRNSYNAKTIEGIGSDWIVARDNLLDEPEIAYFPDGVYADKNLAKLETWTTPVDERPDDCRYKGKDGFKNE